MEKTPPGTSLFISAGLTSNEVPLRMEAAMKAAASSCANTSSLHGSSSAPSALYSL
eukprot:CAMPEP_0181315858 /NCGR_PEP_ID=MMETSP1101-20121128/15593_1 /TAXON_ID=46948 /ORGANISM="Rhodomonas abbreviata, Strain Caron Lab Isolate" /LENGTH=55 /DNA_ID=CAMNT_0023423081 /DNA_START=607 /DNA_END=774 /DNA_ORIENTATION=-